MDIGAWGATVHGVARAGHHLATQPPPPPPSTSYKCNHTVFVLKKKKLAYFTKHNVLKLH